MRNWTVPGQWVPAKKAGEDTLTQSDSIDVPPSAMRRQPLRKSGGFVQIDNIFAELDEEIAATRS